MKPEPPLRPLHEDRQLSQAKLAVLSKADTATLKRSLEPGQEDCLKVRPDGTMLDGHHRVHVLRARGEDVDRLRREVILPT